MGSMHITLVRVHLALLINTPASKVYACRVEDSSSEELGCKLGLWASKRKAPSLDP